MRPWTSLFVWLAAVDSNAYDRGAVDRPGASRNQLPRAVDAVVEAAVRWAAADYGEVDQLRADAALADAVKEYERARAARGLRPRASSLRPDRVDV